MWLLDCCFNRLEKHNNRSETNERIHLQQMCNMNSWILFEEPNGTWKFVKFIKTHFTNEYQMNAFVG